MMLVHFLCQLSDRSYLDNFDVYEQDLETKDVKFDQISNVL